MQTPSFRLAIQEDYFLVDRASRDVVSLIEARSGECDSAAQARAELALLRRDAAARHGLAPVTAAAHPFASGAGTCGMRVAIAVEDAEARADLTVQAAYFLPHLLALSTSSPFWRGVESGLKSVRASLVPDGAASLELRITDVCTRLDDAIAIAALWRCLLRMLWRLRGANMAWRTYPAPLLADNLRRAGRDGIGAALVDFGRGRAVPLGEQLEMLAALVAEDSRAFGCQAEIAAARVIVGRGSSADEQLAVYRQVRAAGEDTAQALADVVDRLMVRTMEGAA